MVLCWVGVRVWSATPTWRWVLPCIHNSSCHQTPSRRMVPARSKREESLDDDLGPEPTLWPPKARLLPPHLRPKEPAAQPHTAEGTDADTAAEENVPEWDMEGVRKQTQKERRLRGKIKLAIIASGAALAWVVAKSWR
mmetsp:Transcript_4947/g.31711  ORF Transcript_4947/g.31711 Transcript_4947/m.31711 type:complete len:138 (+) Transcript_4947:1596-2009(+)